MTCMYCICAVHAHTCKCIDTASRGAAGTEYFKYLASRIYHQSGQFHLWKQQLVNIATSNFLGFMFLYVSWFGLVIKEITLFDFNYITFIDILYIYFFN